MAEIVLRPRTRRASSTLWTRLTRYSFTRSRRSRARLAEFCRGLTSDEYTLVVHSVDVDHGKYFPNSFVISKRADGVADLTTDAEFADTRSIGSDSFNLILCTGLLEHIADPERLIAEFHRILKPGGRLIISASAVFPFHGAPDNYFHFTPNGFRHLFRDWTRLEQLHGSTKPFETIAILLQRINFQCDIFPPVRPLIELLYHTMPLLDRFILRQYDNLGPRDELTPTDSMMPVTLHAVVVK